MEDNLTQRRLEEAFHASGLSQAELARAAGIDRGSISLYLSGRYRPKADKLIRLAAALSVSPEWLSGVEGAEAVEAALPFPVMVGLDESGGLRAGPEQQLIPRASLGGESPEGFFVLQVTGLAMYPRLLEGDRLLVKRTAVLPEGATAVVVQEGALLVRRRQGELLMPANPEFPPRPLTEDTVVLGRAIALIRTL